jgi:glycosyltransferase involved in cell wall biosynthesis
LLRSADLFLFCSRTEGLPNAVLEAMAAGVPVVCTDVPGCRDLIRHGETGWLVRPGDPAAIARGLKMALTDEPSSRRMGRAAQGWVRQKLNSACWIPHWLALYRAIINGNPL